MHFFFVAFGVAGELDKVVGDISKRLKDEPACKEGVISHCNDCERCRAVVAQSTKRFPLDKTRKLVLIDIVWHWENQEARKVSSLSGLSPS